MFSFFLSLFFLLFVLLCHWPVYWAAGHWGGLALLSFQIHGFFKQWIPQRNGLKCVKPKTASFQTKCFPMLQCYQCHMCWFRGRCSVKVSLITIFDRDECFPPHLSCSVHFPPAMTCYCEVSICTNLVHCFMVLVTAWVIRWPAHLWCCQKWKMALEHQALTT